MLDNLLSPFPFTVLKTVTFPFLFLKYSSFMGHLPVSETQSLNMSDILTPPEYSGSTPTSFYIS